MKSSFSTDAVLIWHSGGKYVPKISQPCAQTFLNAFSKLFSFPEGLASRLPGIWSGASTTMEVHGALVTLVVTCQSTALLFFSTKWNTKNKGGEEEQTCRCFFSTHLLPLHTLENNGCVTHTPLHYCLNIQNEAICFTNKQIRKCKTSSKYYMTLHWKEGRKNQKKLEEWQAAQNPPTSNTTTQNQGRSESAPVCDAEGADFHRGGHHQGSFRGVGARKVLMHEPAVDDGFFLEDNLVAVAALEALLVAVAVMVAVLHFLEVPYEAEFADCRDEMLFLLPVLRYLGAKSQRNMDQRICFSIMKN